MSTMANEQRANKALMSVHFTHNSQPPVPANQDFISALSECNIKPSVTTLVARPPSSGVATARSLTVTPHVHTTTATLAKSHAGTNFNM